MNAIKIGNDERPIAGADAQWITQEIVGRRKDGENVCVVISIKTAELDMRLATPACGGAGGRGREPTARERSVLELWQKLHLNEVDFSPGNVVAFVKQVGHYL